MSIATWLRGIIQEMKSGSQSEEASRRLRESSRREEISSIAIAHKNLKSYTKDDAIKLIKRFTPLFKSLNDRKVDYCLVGGLAVMVHSVAAGLDSIRSTDDADLMFDSNYTNQDFARAYLEVFGKDPEIGRRIYNEMFGDGSFDELGTMDQALVSCSFMGLPSDTDVFLTPSFDVVRSLNTLNLADMKPTIIEIDGVGIPVASIDTLLFMKQTTIDYMRNDLHTQPRAKDFVDLDSLQQIYDLTHSEDVCGGRQYEGRDGNRDVGVDR